MSACGGSVDAIVRSDVSLDALKEIISYGRNNLFLGRSRDSTCEIICFSVEIAENDGRVVWEKKYLSGE